MNSRRHGGKSPGPYALLVRNPAYLRVFVAGLGSVAGSAIAGVCLVWIVYASTGSPFDVALLGTAALAGAIPFSVFGGAWVDRYDRRRLMIGSDFSRALALGLVAADLAFRGFDLLPILAAYFVLGAFTTVFNPAEQAIVPSLVGVSEIAAANGLVRSSRSALSFVGASVAGALIVTVGPTAGVAANAFTFLLSGILLVGLRVPARAGAARAVIRTGTSYFADIVEGFRWLVRARGFFQLTVSATFFNFCSAIVSTFLVVFAGLVLHGSALVFALLLAVEVVGTGLGALLVGPTRAVRRAGLAWVVPYGVVSGAVVLVLALVPSVPVAFGAFFALGLLGGYAGTAWLTAAQLLVPSEMQGRYFGIDNLGSVAILPVAQIGGAFLVEGAGIRTAYLATSVVWVVVGLVFLVPRALRDLGHRPPERTATLRSDADASGTPGSPEGTLDE